MSFWDFSLENTGRTQIVSIQYQEQYGRAKKPVFMRVFAVSSVIPTQLVQNLMDKSPAEDQFYLELWTQMCNKTLFPNELTMVSAIIVLMYMPKIPYFCLPQVPTMEDEVYQECTRHVQEQIKRAIYAIEAGYPQKTQLAVQLMRLCNQIKGEKEKTVFIAQILGYYQGQIKQLMDSQKKEKSPNARQDDSGTE